MTAAVIILAAALATAVAGLIALAVSRARVADALGIERALLLTEQRRGDQLELARDAATVASASAIAERDAERRRREDAEHALNAATRKEADRAREEVRTAPDAIAAHNRVLRAIRREPAAGAPHPAAASGAGDGAPAVLHPAVAPDTTPARRGP